MTSAVDQKPLQALFLHFARKRKCSAGLAHFLTFRRLAQPRTHFLDSTLAALLHFVKLTTANKADTIHARPSFPYGATILVFPFDAQPKLVKFNHRVTAHSVGKLVFW